MLVWLPVTSPRWTCDSVHVPCSQWIGSVMVARKVASWRSPGTRWYQPDQAGACWPDGVGKRGKPASEGAFLVVATPSPAAGVGGGDGGGGGARRALAVGG